MENKPNFKFAFMDHLEASCKCIDYDINKFVPTRADDKSSGWDVRCAAITGTVLGKKNYIKVPLGIKVFSPEGWWLRLSPRSSTFIKRHIHALYGVIDQSYEGEIYFCGQYITDGHTDASVNHIDFGDKIGQLIPVRREEMVVDIISNKEFDELALERGESRGARGFGSTGR